MRKMTLLVLLLAFTGAAFGADQAAEQTIALKDGGQVAIPFV